MTLLNADPPAGNNPPADPNPNPNPNPPPPTEIPGWLALIEDKNLQEDETLRRFKSPQALAVSYKEIRSKLGANPVAVPNEKDAPEKWDEFYNKLGRPEKPEKYTFQPPAGVKIEEGTDKEFRAEAHKLGLTQKQFEGLNLWATGLAAKTHENEIRTQNARVEESEAALKKEWSGDYNKNLAIANAALKRFGGDAVIKLLQAKGLDGDATMVKFFASLGKATMEESEIAGLNNSPRSTLRSRAQLEEMMKDKRYWTDPEYRKEVDKGFQALYPQQQAQA